MSIEKVLVDSFEFLENDGELGIAFQNAAEPVTVGALVYDGRNCAILVRNNTKAFLFTNIVSEIRAKLMAADEVMMIEQQGDDISNAYKAKIKKVSLIPYQDTLTDSLIDLIKDLQKAYGIEGLERIIQGLKDENKQ